MPAGSGRGRRHLIGLVLPGDAPRLGVEPFFMELVAGMEQGTLRDLSSHGGECQDAILKDQGGSDAPDFLVAGEERPLARGRATRQLETAERPVDMAAEVHPRDRFLSGVTALDVGYRPQLVEAHFLR